MQNEAEMDYLDTRWTKLKDYDFDNDDSEPETKKFIDSDGESGDEEWVQQLQRDYGKTSSLRIRKRWTKWTTMEKYLMLSLVVAMIIGLLLATIIFIQRFTKSDEQFEISINEGGKIQNVRNMCLTKECVAASYRVNQYYDDKIDPCDDFYQFSCGKWLENIQIPSGNSRWTSFTELTEKNQLTLKGILDRLHPLKNDSEAVNKAHMFYKSCQDYKWMEKNGLSSLTGLIKEIGSWSLWNSTDWNDEDWSFEQALNKIHKLKSMPLFYMFVAADDIRSSENTIQVRGVNCL